MTKSSMPTMTCGLVTCHMYLYVELATTTRSGGPTRNVRSSYSALSRSVTPTLDSGHGLQR